MINKSIGVLVVLFLILSFLGVSAKGITHPITGKSAGAGLLSLLIWPGIGQAVNDQPGKKIAWHAVIGIFPPFRFWSGYDALVKRDGGYLEGKI